MKRILAMTLALTLCLTLAPAVFAESSWIIPGPEFYKPVIVTPEPIPESIVKEKDKTHEHDFGDWTVTTVPKCNDVGRKYRICKTCGAIQVEDVPKTAHSFGKWYIIKEATCKDVGYRYRSCSICGFRALEEIERLPHKYGDWEITTAATDHTKGIRTRTCEVCGEKETASFYPDGTLRNGSYGVKVKEMQEKLVEQGFLDKHYADGDFGSHTYRAIKSFQKTLGLDIDGIAWPQTLKLIDHEFSEWTVTKAPDYFNAGEKSRKCSECGWVQTVPIGKLLRSGNSGDDVKQLQQRLNELGYGVGFPDGVYGDNTRRAVRNFQTDIGFDADGITWPGVWNELFPDEAVGNAKD